MNSEDPNVAGGCTVGVVRLQGGILFFKNRDLAEQYRTNRMSVWQSTAELHVLKGANLKTGELEGIAIGVNRHGVCVANTHLCSTPDVTYDLLCEELVRRARSRDDVFAIAEGFVEQQRVQGGKILVASPAWTLLVEVLGDEYQIQDIEGSFAMTNDFALISHEPERAEVHTQSSRIRHEVATEMIRTITGIGALKGMLRSHLPEKGPYSICNHGQDGFGTETSHIIEVREGYVAWSHLVGLPCENDYVTVRLFQGI
jgi:hypothetical protein